MKKLIIASIALSLSYTAPAQWGIIGNNIYSNVSGNVGIGLADPRKNYMSLEILNLVTVAEEKILVLNGTLQITEMDSDIRYIIYLLHQQMELLSYVSQHEIVLLHGLI